jgi:hypothetical protein
VANTIKIKSSGVTSNTPGALEHGELAINYADGKLYYKNSSNTIVEFGGGGGVTDHGALTGLADDDHTQYLLADGTRTATSLTVSGNLTVDTNMLFVDSTNNEVGIGTISPTTKLDILGLTTEDPILSVRHNGGSAGHAGIAMTSTGSGGRTWTLISADAGYTHGDGFHVLNSTSGHMVSIKALGTNLGSIGIGTTSPSAALDVVGDAEINGSMTVTGNIVYTQTMDTKTASYTVVSSDVGKLLYMNNGANNHTVTVDSSTGFSVGQRVDILRTGTGSVTVVQGSGATVYYTPALTLRAQNSAATLVCTGSNQYHLIGDLG